MAKTLNLFLSFAFCFIFYSVSWAESIINIPVRFHIVTDLEIKKDRLSLDTWITERDIKTSVLPEINRIWASANIQFSLDSIITSPYLKVPDQHSIKQFIANAHRNEDGESDPERIKQLSKLINFQHENANSLNIFFVPYLGEASQGNAKRKLQRAFIAQWTDKPSKGKRAPERFQLIEHGSFKEGSLSRTTAHEIGHLLGLKHPDKKTQTSFNLLMGGKNAGYSFTEEEIKQARKNAKKLSSNH